MAILFETFANQHDIPGRAVISGGNRVGTILSAVASLTHRQRTRLYLLCASAVALAQNPDAGRIERAGNQATLIVDHPRPLDAAAIALAEGFGLRVSVEDPVYIYKDDVKEVVAPNLRKGFLAPKGGRLEVSFAVNDDGSPADAAGMLSSLVDTANRQFPFAYRLEMEGDSYTIVPTRTRDRPGNVVEVIPLLDRRVTIPAGTRMIMESANLMGQALSAQTGLRVSCCQAFVAGIPWGMAKIEFEARDEPARGVLKRLIHGAAASQGQASRSYWLLRCDPLPSAWCFINLAWVTRSEPNGRSARPNVDPSRWFVRTP